MPLSQHNIDITQYDHIIWDWNGTLLDDVELCIDVVGKLLTAHGLPIPTVDHYREIFGFPVRDYYEALGFDFSITSFEDLADQYIADYDSRADQAPLHVGALPLLDAIAATGVEQSILSAANEAHVVEITKQFGLQDYFKHIYGIHNHHAASKQDRGLELISETGIAPARTLMIGDTIHDHEVGAAMGVDVLLVAHGHQSIQRLKNVHHMVVTKL
ncbi:MAG: HAD family hydrolase [Alphaproteobacteria bacterium]|nr:MAG: HAD family hydrolase [Alphaproteobacteria bacterium]